MTLEKRVSFLLEQAFGEAVTKASYDVVAYGFIRDDVGWTSNDAWYIDRDCDYASVLRHARGRWEVYKVNYASRARIIHVVDEGDYEEVALTDSANGLQWLSVYLRNER